VSTEDMKVNEGSVVNEKWLYRVAGSFFGFLKASIILVSILRWYGSCLQVSDSTSSDASNSHFALNCR
jgi:hypothetical protein